jgi:multiple sugar transport system substrate-binding protein
VSDDGLAVSGYLDTPEAIQGIKNYQSLFVNKLSPTAAIRNQFGTGVAATAFVGVNWAARFDAPGGDPGFKWGVSPTPRGKIVFNCNASDSPLVWSKTTIPAEAVALLAFICNDTNRIEFHRIWGSMPARQSLVQRIPVYSTKQPYQLASVLAANSYTAPKTVGWFDYFNAINPAVKDIALGADAGKTLHDVSARIDMLLRKYKH